MRAADGSRTHVPGLEGEYNKPLYDSRKLNSCNILEKYIYGLEPSPRALQARALTN